MGRLDVRIGQYSDKGGKERNDDSYGVVVPEDSQLLTKGIAMAIADGMSTSEAAKEASESCIKSFLMDYYATHDSWTVKTSVARVLTAVNRWLYGQGQTQYLSDRGMVTTFSGMVIKGAVGYIFHAGDSRISLLRDGSLEPLTIEHRTRLSRSEEVLSRAFGIDPELDVDFKTLEIFARDVLLFTTDGVHDFLTNQETTRLIEENGTDLVGAAQALCDLAIENGSSDNVTAQIVAIDDVGERTQKEAETEALKAALPFPPDLEPGMVFEGLKILKLIHASNKTQIYLAQNEETGDKVVLKTPSINFVDDPLYLEHFTREEWIGRSLSSPHVVKVIEPTGPKKFLYYTTEFIDGMSLQQWMDENPAPSLQEVRDIVVQIARGLRAFHRKEMLHQDLKPGNIMIGKDGIVKLVDFGSTFVAGLEEIGREDALQLRGTVDYTAPEYHLGARPTKQVDIFSLGVIAYEMLTGKLPFGKGFQNKAAVKGLSQVAAHHRRDDIPPWVSSALARAVNKDPSLRYETLSSFEQDLARPNPKYATEHSGSFLERNPLTFWRTLALAMGLLNVILIYRLISGG